MTRASLGGLGVCSKCHAACLPVCVPLYLSCSYNKTLLKAFPHPLTVTNIQFLIGSVISVMLWVTGAVKPPKLDAKMVSRKQER